jgi:hypothetical protein
MEESIEISFVNHKTNLGVGLSNAPKSFESCDVGLIFQFKMLKFINFMNQKLQVDKDKKA